MSEPRIVDAAPTAASGPVADCLTMDGRVVQVRPVVAADAPALLALHQRLSPHNRYLRFFSAGASGSPARRAPIIWRCWCRTARPSWPPAPTSG
jgi:hypothetical protein